MIVIHATPVNLIAECRMRNSEWKVQIFIPQSAIRNPNSER
jgi:hypothetical protein